MEIGSRVLLRSGFSGVGNKVPGHTLHGIVTAIETNHVLVAIEGKTDAWGYPLRRWVQSPASDADFAILCEEE